jgi:hypothetical protein
MVTAFLIVLATVVAIFGPAIYFRRQRLQCRKYPFFGLRDRVILAMVNADDPELLLESYDRVNFVIERLHRFDLGFFLDVMRSVIEEAISDAYERALQEKNAKMELALNQYDRDLVALLVESARSHSLLIRLAMTRFVGLMILFPPKALRGFLRFIVNRLPALINSQKPRIRALKQYVMLSQSNLARTC